ncbi:MAG: hypothetical protein EAY70_09280 [Sphingomonadales bacterium]|nr:MAG: hypothetical protein EAY70_09280 [Sphingomonadales bacterium]
MTFALLLAALTGCAGDPGTYPSLAMRPFERGETPEPLAPALPIRPATPAARLTELRDAATSSHTAFVARESEAARLVRAAAGQPFESRARGAALVALADLDTQRSKTAGTLAALDALAAEAAGALSPDPALATAQSDVAAVLAREDAAITRLWEAMGS